MFKRISLFLVFGLIIVSQAIASPTNDVKKTVDEVVKIVTKKEMKKHNSDRRKALKASISLIFDYGEMAKRSLGKNWNNLSPAERNQFTDLFSTLLESSYAGKIESYNDEKIIYIKETVDNDYAEVKSKLITNKRDEYTLDYRLLNKAGRWMAYDVVIEGVSLVSNYRTQFNKIISTGGYGALLKKLQVKSDDL